jgi:hypothetical protein
MPGQPGDDLVPESVRRCLVLNLTSPGWSVEQHRKSSRQNHHSDDENESGQRPVEDVEQSVAVRAEVEPLTVSILHNYRSTLGALDTHGAPEMGEVLMCPYSA